jgi:two-component system cell cycle response regulator
MFDLDYFKEINDTVGHSIGDEVLKTVVANVQAILRESDTLARLGGEEFYILLPETKGEAALLVAERFRALIENINTIQVGSNTIRLTASFGVSQIDLKITDFEESLKQVDKALYQAKAAGRNCVVRL